MKVINYSQFINESFYKKIKKSKKNTTSSNSIESCLVEIINYLEENNIYNWNQFLGMSPLKREVVNKIIDKLNSLSESKEIIFLLKLNLYDRLQLRELISEYEESGDWNKCSQILKKLGEK